MDPMEEVVGTVSLNANTFTKADYDFLGWSLTVDGSVAYADEAEVNVNSDLTLYAVWGIITYQITFDSNGGSGIMDPMEDVIGVVTLNSNTYSKVGYTFQGWSTSADGSEEYNDEDNVDVIDDITLYAVWKQETFTLTFYSNGGEGYMNAVNDIVGNYILPANSFTNEGYTFQGWSTSANGSVEYEDEDTVDVIDDLTLYAVWELNTYTLTFDSNGGEGYMDDVIDIVGDYDLPANSFTKEGYIFLGWSISADGEVEYEDEDMIEIDSDITLYAVWDMTSGVDDAGINQIKIYPNPAHDYVFIEGDFSNEAYVQIYSIAGSPMAKYPLSFMKNKISITDLDQGVYLLYIKDRAQEVKQKLIVK